MPSSATASSPTRTLLLLALLHVGVSCADHGFHSFVSRPDIKAPIWDIILYPQDGPQLAPGYWFVAPYRGHNSKEFAPDRGWVGPHIYDQDGSLIWSDAELVEAPGGIGAVEAFSLSQVDFGEGGGVEAMLTAMDLRTSKAVFINNRYKISRKEQAQGPGGYNTHELNFVEDGTRALVLYNHFAHNASEAESRLVGFEGRCHSICNGIVEYDVKTWDRTWIWSSCEDEFGKGSIALDESTMNDKDVVQDRCGKLWDYVHANSVDKTPKGDYIFSSRHADALYKISHKDGSIIWRLGGLKSDFVHVEDFRFTRQHHVRYRGGNSTHTFISFLDNAKGQERWRGPSYPFSRGLMLVLDEAATPMTARIIAQYNHPDGPGNYAHRRGGCQILPNGNVFMGWSEQALMSEHASDGTILMQARLRPKWIGSYRAFKFENWVGMPTDPPDVVARAVKPTNPDEWTRTEVFVSWNGATEVNRWNLYHSTSTGDKRELLTTARKLSFETVLTSTGPNSTYPRHVLVEALAYNNSILSSSMVIEVPLVDEADIDDGDEYLETLDSVPRILSDPIFIVFFVVTVAVVALAWGWWAFRVRRRSKSRRSLRSRESVGGKDSSPTLPQYSLREGHGSWVGRLLDMSRWRGIWYLKSALYKKDEEQDCADKEGMKPLIEAKE